MTKVQVFQQELQDTAVVFKALGHPARLAILKYLAETKVCISGDISDAIPLSRTTVHQHLTELKNAGWIKGEISGVKRHYCLNSKNIKKFKSDITDFLTNIDLFENLNC